MRAGARHRGLYPEPDREQCRRGQVGLNKADAYLQDLLGVTPERGAAKPKPVSRNDTDEVDREYAAAIRYLTGRGVELAAR